MSLLKVTKAKTKETWRGKTKIDHSEKGKEVVVNTADILRIEKFDTGSCIHYRDGEEQIVFETLDELSSLPEPQEEEEAEEEE